MVHKEWDDVTVSFLDNIVVPADLDDPDGHRRLRRLKDTLSHESNSAQLRLECAAVATLAYSLIESTYLLEGDGPTSLIAYDLVVANRQHLVAFASSDMEAWPARLRAELEVVRNDITCGGLTQDEATALLKKVVAKAAKPALAYFHRTIFGPDAANAVKAEMHRDMLVYRTARCLSPISARLLQPTWATVNQGLVATGSNLYFTDGERAGMNEEWPTYLSLTQELDIDEDDGSPNHKMHRALLFWRAARITIPNIAKLARYFIIIATSSAAAERVFSVLKASNSLVQMHQALEDLTEIICQRQYNHRE